MGLAVLSHFVLDVIVHTPDMPIFGNARASYKMGLRLWIYDSIVSYIVEGVILSGGLFIYLKATKDSSFVGKYGMVSLVAVLFGLNGMFTYVQPPSDPRFSWALALTLYVSITLAAFWLDKHALVQDLSLYAS